MRQGSDGARKGWVGRTEATTGRLAAYGARRMVLWPVVQPCQGVLRARAGVTGPRAGVLKVREKSSGGGV